MPNTDLGPALASAARACSVDASAATQLERRRHVAPMLHGPSPALTPAGG